jgi:hypothetical protein
LFYLPENDQLTAECSDPPVRVTSLGHARMYINIEDLQVDSS